MDDFILEVQTGEMDTLLGLNGAGRIALICCRSAMVGASAGQVAIVHRPLTDHSCGRRSTTSSRHLGLPRADRPGEPGGPPQAAQDPHRAAVEDTIALVGLRPSVDRRTPGLSLGDAQRLGWPRHCRPAIANWYSTSRSTASTPPWRPGRPSGVHSAGDGRRVLHIRPANPRARAPSTCLSDKAQFVRSSADLRSWRSSASYAAFGWQGGRVLDRQKASIVQGFVQ